MAQVRAPAVAGLFYPADPDELSSLVRGLLGEAAPTAEQAEFRPAPKAPKAIVAPHAGYVYSGPLAARAYAAVAGLENQVRRVVLIGPAHTVYSRGIAVPTVTAFETPLGAFDIDRHLIDSIADLPGVVLSDEPHAREHCLEVQLPFIRLTLGAPSLVPLLVGDSQAGPVAEVLERLWGGPETLIVVSSDLSHFLSYERARRIDAATAEAIEAFDDAHLGPGQACGHGPLAGLLRTARRRGLEIERLGLLNSGDTAGPRDRVVGYGAWALRPPSKRVGVGPEASRSAAPA